MTKQREVMRQGQGKPQPPPLCAHPGIEAVSPQKTRCRCPTCGRRLWRRWPGQEWQEE